MASKGGLPQKFSANKIGAMAVACVFRHFTFTSHFAAHEFQSPTKKNPLLVREFSTLRSYGAALR